MRQPPTLLWQCTARVASYRADLAILVVASPIADNELSPECLDGAQSFLADDGISIPCKYVSYLAPITSSKLHNEVKAYSDLVHFETPCVESAQLIGD